MEIKDNIIKHKLENVYFIAGTNCGGKSSMAKALSEKHDMVLYSADDHYWNHRPYSTEKDQPLMNRAFLGWEEYFARNPQEQAAWLMAAEEEEVDFILLDLIELAYHTKKKIIVDMHCVPDVFKKITTDEKVIFLMADSETIQKEFFAREDKTPLLECIHRETRNPNTAIQNVLSTAKAVGAEETRRAQASGYKMHVRNANTSFEERTKIVEDHFRLG